jgi:hypothetical protein
MVSLEQGRVERLWVEITDLANEPAVLVWDYDKMAHLYGLVVPCHLAPPEVPAGACLSPGNGTYCNTRVRVWLGEGKEGVSYGTK